jgi:hypothetical protein
MVERYLGLATAPGLLLFRTRLGMTVIDLTSGVERSGAAQAATRLLGDAVVAGDGYAARDVLAHDGCKAMLTDADKRTLASAVRSSGLGHGAMPAHLKANVLAAVQTSETAVARILRAPVERIPR